MGMSHEMLRIGGGGNRAREMFAASMAHQAMEPPGHVFDSMPFHLKMIECLLKETSNFFHQRVER